jgi:hypothetical protein
MFETEKKAFVDSAALTVPIGIDETGKTFVDFKVMYHVCEDI